MLPRRIAAAATTTTAAVLAAPAAAMASHGSAHPSATPLLVELAAVALVSAGLLARRPLAKLARSSWSRVTRPRRVPRSATTH